MRCASSSRTEVFASMIAYIFGCVKRGSSPSLWPNFGTPQVDGDVAVEALPIVRRDARHARHGVDIFRVHVEDRHAEEARDIRGVAAGARIAGGRRKAHLVVQHDVDRAARLVPLELGEVEGLRDDTLAHEGGVAVDEHRADRVTREVPTLFHLRPNSADHDRVHELQVARVEAERDVDVVPLRRGVVRRLPEVVLHVTAAEILLGVLVLEGREELGLRLAEDVHRDVQAAAVGHADDDVLHHDRRPNR